MNEQQNNGTMTTTKEGRMYTIKDGRKKVLEILVSRDGKSFTSFQHGLGICIQVRSLEECIDRSFAKIAMMNEDLKSRILAL